MMRIRGLRVFAAASSIALGVTPCLSDVADPDDASGPLPVLISPDWRLIDAQRTPRTVDHFQGGELDRAGVSNTIDLQYRSPGFVFKTNTVLGQPYLRGVGSDFISAGAESSVAAFIDGVYLPRAYDLIVDFYDVDRVEVIKGPQGVHLGRNVVGGAVSIHTVDPQPYRSGYVDFMVGNYNRRQVRGAVNVPFADSAWAMRVAGIVSRRDGYMENIFLNTDANDEDYHALRAKLLYEPSTDFSALFTAERYRESSSRAMGSQPDPDVGTNGGIEMGGTVPDDPRKITENIPPGIDLDADRYSLRLIRNLNGIELRSTTAHLTTDAALALDLDGTDADYSANYPSGDSTAWTQELRLSTSPHRKVSWVAGVFLLEERANQTLDVRLPQTDTRNVPDGTVDTRAYALFGELGYRFDPHWRTTAGLRYSHDHREIDLVRTVTAGGSTTVTEQRERGSWQALTPEFGVEFTPNPLRLYYARVSRGYKAGGFNTSTIQDPFDPEFLWAYEVGYKASSPDRRSRFNASLFHYDYRDLQLNTPPSGAPPGTFPRVINAARATITGIELDTLWGATPSLDLRLGVTLMEARFRRFDSVDPNNPGVDPDRSGNRLPQAPDLSANLGAAYRWPLSHGTLTLHGDYRYQSEVYFNIYEDPAVRQGSYGLLNAGLAYDSHGRNDWYGELYVNNITDELYAQTILRNDPLTGTKRHWGAPRTVGLRVGYRW
jgi:iron complex outermembrane recepter protein